MPPSATAQAVAPFSQAHRRYVAHLYRRALKGALDWYVRRDLWRERAIEIRVQFERNRNVRDPRAVAALLHEAEKAVQDMSHPDPYRASMFPDGTKWERNLPPPMFTQEQKAQALKAFRDGH
ncbi:BZ3500_MvSof-1268-A1-R1_Chr2-1g04249 [Microbotryum saponariae]|uniref:NADH dehydrogenase [ubiquinone] 1 beta subcomplex subunit 9 n=1 Tax=Microbotryum saponariae TaxID=289078 RepID=A0A2X0KYF7_9BASI|nr:BZ3500_MvSof-1268-A1-R1_Chr2-1g04249 [Microbotryum saponariae]SCZ91236.1 BZ3501_MvSof-1269-A2-R1_Chr2-1g03905 [Microbotryum saponariae]